MQFFDVKARLDDLPPTFVRPGAQFQTIDLAQTAALFRYTGGSDGVISQLNFAQAIGPWLDAWGKLFSVARNINESDDAYQNRIVTTLLANCCTPNAILIYMKTLGFEATIEEDFVNVAYHIEFSTPLTTAGFTALAQNLDRVRPAGVPFTFQVLQGGLYVGTVNFLNAPKVTGAYLDTPLKTFIPTISQSTNNSIPLLPTLFLSDTTINPGLASQAV